MKTAEKEIKELLDSKGVTAYRLSKESGITRGELSKYFSGKREMTANRYLYIKQILTKY